jgi:hypothetical protein
MDNQVKFEPLADQTLKRADHKANLEDELRMFCRSFAVTLRRCDVVFGQQVSRSVW